MLLFKIWKQHNSSNYSYDDNSNITEKNYNNSKSITNSYNAKNRINSTSYNNKTYNYTYDTNNQLTAVSGTNYSASYAYNSQGNITSKAVNGITTSFNYFKDGWNDKLTSVNGVSLTYDANGNVLTYGDKSFTWSSGKNLASITDGNNTYSYTYDENGIRTSKTVNGVTTYYNTRDGVILSQTDGTNTIYFQYDNYGVPIGLIRNGQQYFYITNQIGDVVAITDVNGTVVGNYEYDAWGNEIGNDTSDIAIDNPLRYRGYYYDSETEYYYLQSRYYDASICRFINSDNVIYSLEGKDYNVGINLFAYCNNNPINKIDPTGRIPNMLVVDWKATATQILIYVKNCGVDTVDAFYGTVKVINGSSKSFSAYNLKAFKTTTIKVNINMTRCDERITVSFYGVDGKREFGKGSSNGSRKIPSSLSSLWNKGTFKSVYDSINYHYSKHHNEVGTNDIVSYATKAQNYRNSVVSDIKNLSNNKLKSKYTITISNGSVPAKKYKHKTNKQYIIISNSGYKILSYGK